MKMVIEMTIQDLRAPDWSEEIAEELAQIRRVKMTRQEWKVVHALRKDFAQCPEKIPSMKILRNMFRGILKNTAFAAYTEPALEIAGLPLPRC